ncbi:hypothetical protein IWX90DRAFT_304676 [Phyllosticta citrichinensis]|uniref:Uncharacterized protein n=1 Tax=Phyllosticta citrichinensis TaxID=1130410 RepID=A0ABR1XLF6_9PEZI
MKSWDECTRFWSIHCSETTNGTPSAGESSDNFFVVKTSLTPYLFLLSSFVLNSCSFAVPHFPGSSPDSTSPLHSDYALLILCAPTMHRTSFYLALLQQPQLVHAQCLHIVQIRPPTKLPQPLHPPFPTQQHQTKPHNMAEQRQHSKTPHRRGFRLHRQLIVINYNVVNAPNSLAACASCSHAVRKRELVLRHIAEKEVAVRVEAWTRRRRLLQRAGERAAGSRGTMAPEQKQQQRSHAMVSSRSSAHCEVEQVSSFRDAIEISEEDEAAFHAELAQSD